MDAGLGSIAVITHWYFHRSHSVTSVVAGVVEGILRINAGLLIMLDSAG